MLHPYENQSKLLGCQGWVEISIITLVYSKRVSVRNNLLYSAVYTKIWCQSYEKVFKMYEHNWQLIFFYYFQERRRWDFSKIEVKLWQFRKKSTYPVLFAFHPLKLIART